MTEPLAMGTHLIVLSESFPMNNNMTGFSWFSLHPCALDKSSLSFGRVKVIVNGLLHYYHIDCVVKSHV